MSSSPIIDANLRATALVVTVAATGLHGSVLSDSVGGGHQTAILAWTVSVVAWCWVASLYGLASLCATVLASAPLVQLALDGVASLATLADAIALSAVLGVVDCGDISSATESDWIGFGSADTEHRCRMVQAGTVLIWILCVLFSLIAFFTFRSWRVRAAGRRSPPGRPNMSQPV
ncbi:Membrane-associating domain [Geosmithia morbida]|uniref:Membrane-associating domain n=1 Tax=Geosmithia morbida TaxID=1094350 RepID=A0A9P4Z1Z9_9HYPO|nr:Membrane-associating domain [Geosmithia morbida]KAF4125803.1 Membrane-associating domain [Geosmithia morbida]